MPTKALVSVFALAVAGLAMPSLASADAAPPSADTTRSVPLRGARVTLGLELGNGRMPLFPQNGESKPKARESLLVGGRIAVDYGIARHLSLELAFAVDSYAMRSLVVYDLVVAPRIRFVTSSGRSEWYVRPLLGVAFLAPSSSHTGLSAGLGFGFRRQVSPHVDAFVEIGYRLRWVRNLDADFAARTWPSYGMPAGALPSAMFCVLGVVGGVGFSMR